MRGSNKLSARAVAAAKPGVSKKDGRLFNKLYGDGNGLWLQVSKFGTKAWLFRWQRDGRPENMGLGPLHTIPLAEARKRAAAARLMVHDGIDPREAKKAERARRKVEAAKAVSFWQCATRYIEAHRTGWRNAKHVAQWASTFGETRRGSRVFPAATEAINGLPVAAVDTGLVLKVLEPMWAKTPESARRTRGRIEAVLDWARVRGYRDGDNPARWSGHLDHILPARNKVVKHHAAIAYRDLPAFMADLRAKSGVAAQALELAILCAARTSEVIGAKWSEIDLEAGLWTVPAGRMKAGREHCVPLSARAVEILAGLPRDGAFVFPGGRAGRPLGTNALLEVVHDARGDGTVHGFRSSFRDWAGNETNFPRELAEHALAHVIGDKAEQAYRRSDALARRRKLMDAWAKFCGRPAASQNNVTPIRERAP
jgi:integrase